MRQQKVTYSPFIKKYRTQAYQLQRHREGSLGRGLFWGLLMVSPFWILVAYLIAR